MERLRRSGAGGRGGGSFLITAYLEGKGLVTVMVHFNNLFSSLTHFFANPEHFSGGDDHGRPIQETLPLDLFCRRR